MLRNLYIRVFRRVLARRAAARLNFALHSLSLSRQLTRRQGA